MTQKALIIDVCREDQECVLLGAANSITDLSDSTRERLEAEYMRREANGEAPIYAGTNIKVRDRKQHAHSLLSYYINKGCIKKFCFR